MKSSPHLPQLKKAHAQQQKPNTAKNKLRIKKNKTLTKSKLDKMSKL